jgi:xanthine dehydrogenase accessory factor
MNISYDESRTMEDTIGAAAYRRLRSALERGERAVLATVLRGEGAEAERVCLTEKELLSSAEAPDGGTENTAAIAELSRRALKEGSLVRREQADGTLLLAMPRYPQPRLVVLGAGHIAVPLVELGSMMGFKVTVCDDRPSFANPARFPSADRVICEYWEKCFELLALDPSCYIVIITRGHRYDMECFRQAAALELPYVGMIGSRRRIAGVKARLLEEGIPREALDRLHAPIGLDIGAVTPQEIALAIIAEVVAMRRKEAGDRGSIDTDPAVPAELCEPREERRALVTVLGSSGSVPRGAGAQMLVGPRGETLGSIGGGCSESDVILAALDIIREGGYVLRRIDLSGSVAEDEGMVCGGTMEILIEAV